jgi:hypothetical protein
MNLAGDKDKTIGERLSWVVPEWPSHILFEDEEYKRPLVWMIRPASTY